MLSVHFLRHLTRSFCLSQLRLGVAYVQAACAEDLEGQATTNASVGGKGSKPSSRASTPPTTGGGEALSGGPRSSKARVMYNPMVFGLPTTQLKK